MSAPDPLFRVLFVCTGNTCRSPLAQVALVGALGDAAAKVAVGSAGTAAFDGAPASAPSREVARRSGLDLEEHRSRRLTRALLAAADLVLLMDPRDRALVRALDSEAAARTHGLVDFGRERSTGEAIPDPYGGSAEAYEECLRRIETHLERVVPHVRAAVAERTFGAR